MSTSRRLLLSVPPTVLCLADAGLTLWGQPSSYWTGAYASAEELNPVGYLLLAWHPLAFVLGVLSWIAAFSTLLSFVSARWVLLIAFVLSFGHAVGGAGWLARRGGFGWVLAALFLVAAERLVVYSWSWSGIMKMAAGEEEPR